MYAGFTERSMPLSMVQELTVGLNLGFSNSCQGHGEEDPTLVSIFMLKRFCFFFYWRVLSMTG